MSSTILEKSVYVPALKDRFGDHQMMIWGIIPLATKVSTSDTGGALFSFQHTNMSKGGPPRHVHYDQDEWFYIVAGEFDMEVGDDKYHLKAGDSVYAPRGIPHVWACVSNQPGTMLTTVTPAGTFEAFLMETTKHTTVPSEEEIAEAFAAHAMSVVGPPMKVD